ncbi:MAG: L-serine ammonia-lyase, iron-sulfur-dependent, subunit alpha [Clostridiaceae bacterium]
MENKDFLDILDKELVVALGCTEPISIALAAAVARKYLKVDQGISLEVSASGNIIKNAMGVYIPGTGKTGMNLAAALGSLGDSDRNLEVLCGLKLSDIETAAQMISEGRVSVKKADTTKKLYIEVIARSKDAYSKVIIEDRHSNITYIEVNGEILLGGEEEKFVEENSEYPYLNIDSIWKFVEEVDLGSLGKIEESIRLNTLIGFEGIRNNYGLKVGKTIYDTMQDVTSSNDMVNYAIALTAGGSDARMAGSLMKVMSNSGSGNQGITATLPLVAFWERSNLSKEVLLRATTLSQLVTIYIKSKFGRLSALCGATIAATGASCGLTYLMGGGKKEARAAIQNMLGNVTGMVCDGAKGGCALKVATCTSAACMSAKLAMNGISIGCTEGIIENDAEKTIDNLCRLGNQGTFETERIILEIMLNKENAVKHQDSGQAQNIKIPGC